VSTLELRDVVKHYATDVETVKAVDGVSLTVSGGELVALYGPSGSGKTTLLMLAAALDSPDSGSISFDGQLLSGMSERDSARYRRRDVGFVFQSFHLMPHTSALDNATVKLTGDGCTLREGRRRALPWLERVGLAARADHTPEQLSMGERQRIAIARALANEPLVVLADEPTGNLDSAATLEVLRLFDSLREAGQTLVVVTHDTRIAATADRMISMRDGAFVEETRLTGGTTGHLAALAGLDG